MAAFHDVHPPKFCTHFAFPYPSYMPSPSYPVGDLYKSQISRYVHSASLLRKQPIAGSETGDVIMRCLLRAISVLRGRRQVVQWWLAGKTQTFGEKPAPVTLRTWRHLALNPRLCAVSYVMSWAAHWLFPSHELLLSPLSHRTHPEI
jgi:hypothetical protein